MELRTLADWVVRQRLLTIPGVAQVVTMGGGRMQFQVLVNPESLAEIRRHARTTSSRRSRRATQTRPAAILNQGGNELLVRSLGRIEDVEELAETSS